MSKRVRPVATLFKKSLPSRDATYQTLPGREYLNSSPPGRVWYVTSRLVTGKSLTFFTVYLTSLVRWFAHHTVVDKLLLNKTKIDELINEYYGVSQCSQFLKIWKPPQRSSSFLLSSAQLEGTKHVQFSTSTSNLQTPELSRAVHRTSSILKQPGRSTPTPHSSGDLHTYFYV